MHLQIYLPNGSLPKLKLQERFHQHVEQHLKCTSHNPILFGYKISYQRVVHCYVECGRE